MCVCVCVCASLKIIITKVNQTRETNNMRGVQVNILEMLFTIVTVVVVVVSTCLLVKRVNSQLVDRGCLKIIERVKQSCFVVQS